MWKGLGALGEKKIIKNMAVPPRGCLHLSSGASVKARPTYKPR